jgi:Holliday junction resolvase RusA-like endonuclease
MIAQLKGYYTGHQQEDGVKGKKEKVRIVLPHLPEKEASPNYTKGHFYGLNKVRRNQHEEVMILVRNEGVPDTPWDKAHLHIKWRASDRRRRDPDNLLGAMKGHIDGLHYSGLIKDDSAQCLSISMEYEEKAETDETIMEITRASDTTA